MSLIAKNLAQLKLLFTGQLKNMLSPDALGAFILVLANSQQDKNLQGALAIPLKSIVEKLKQNFYADKLNATRDDVQVFEQLLKNPLDKIEPWQHKNMGDWELVYNSMRQLRPARASTQVLTTIKQPFDEAKFHFNKPFLKPEILWQGIYQDKKLRVLFNKFPFCAYHLLLVVSPEKNKPQLLTEAEHIYIFELAQSQCKNMAGFGLAFNSLAAGASVNHLHFQGFIRAQKFPIEKDIWQHHGGEKKYPLAVNFFTNADTAWAFISHLIEKNQAFNCLYREGGCYVVPRKYQTSVDTASDIKSITWLDVAGVVTLSDKEVFNTISAQDIEQDLAQYKST